MAGATVALGHLVEGMWGLLQVYKNDRGGIFVNNDQKGTRIFFVWQYSNSFSPLIGTIFFVAIP